jgi:hypothetical protein
MSPNRASDSRSMGQLVTTVWVSVGRLIARSMDRA